MAGLLPLLRWPGGQNKLASRIAAALPDHDTYVEPFAGGASVFWRKKPAAELEVLGDREGWMIAFLDKTRRGALDACRPVEQNENTFQVAIRGHKAGDACSTLLLNKMSFEGEMKHRCRYKDGSTVGRQHLGNRGRYTRRLRRTHLVNSDFAETMRRFDGPDTLHYLDPPWSDAALSKDYAKNHYTYGVLSLDHVAKVASEMEGKVAISYQDDPRVRKILQHHGLHLYRIPITMGGNKPSKESTRGRKTHRLLATNWRLPAKLKRRR